MGSKVLNENKESLFRNAHKEVSEWTSIQKMMEEFKRQMSREWTDEEKVIKWSDGNSKTHLPSYSTMPGFACMTNGKYPPCFTSGNCYAIYDLRNPDVIKNCVHNTVLIIKYPEEFRSSLDLKMKMESAIKIHIEGDFINRNELRIVDETRKANPYCHVITYTKKYDLANRYMDDHGKIEDNFTLIFSRWDGLKMNNPYNMPECHVYKTVGEYRNANEFRKCGTLEGNEFTTGNCAMCFMNHILGNGKGGCFDLETDTAIAMIAH